MKVRGFMFVVALTGLIFSCSEEVEPTLIITVEDSLGTKLEGATVYTHPCLDQNSPCDRDRLNEAFIQDKKTNSAGQATFEFPYSAIVDVFSQYVAPSCDSNGTDTSGLACLQSGRTIARFETKEVSAGEDNNYYAKVVVIPEY